MSTSVSFANRLVNVDTVKGEIVEYKSETETHSLVKFGRAVGAI